MYTLHSAAVRRNRATVTMPATKHNNWNAVEKEIASLLDLANFVPDNLDDAYGSVDFCVVKDHETHSYVVTYVKNSENTWVKTYESKPMDMAMDMVNAARYNHPDCDGCPACMKEA